MHWLHLTVCQVFFTRRLHFTVCQVFFTCRLHFTVCRALFSAANIYPFVQMEILRYFVIEINWFTSAGSVTINMISNSEYANLTVALVALTMLVA